MILAAVGKNASGKDYFLEFIKKNYDIPMLSMGDVVRDLAEKEGLEKTRDNLHMVSQKYMSQYGQDFFPKQLIKMIKERGYENVLVSGIRPPSDAAEFKKAFGNDFYLVAIVVGDDRTRWERTVSRGEARDHVTFEKFLELDAHEEELFHTSETIAMADYQMLRGNLSDEEYHAKIREFYESHFKK